MAYVSTRRQALQGNQAAASTVNNKSYVSERRKNINKPITESVEPVATKPVTVQPVQNNIVQSDNRKKLTVQEKRMGDTVSNGASSRIKQTQKDVQDFIYKQGLKQLDDKYKDMNAVARSYSPEYQADVTELAKSVGYDTTPAERNVMYNPEATESTLPYLGEKAKMGLMDFASGFSNLNEIGKMGEGQKTLTRAQRMQLIQDMDKAEFQKAESENVSKGLQTVGNIVQATTAMIPNIMLSAANPAMGLAQVGLSAAGNSAQEAMKENASKGQALAYGALSGGIEAGTEKLFGGLPFMKGIGDKAASKLINPIKNKVIKSGVKWAMNMGEEALEEGIAGAVNPLAKRLTYDKNAPMATASEIAEQMLMGAAVAGILGIPGTVMDATGNQTPTIQAIKDVDNNAITFTMADGSTLELNPAEMDKADLQELNESITESAISSEKVQKAKKVIENSLDKTTDPVEAELLDEITTPTGKADELAEELRNVKPINKVDVADAVEQPVQPEIDGVNINTRSANDVAQNGVQEIDDNLIKGENGNPLTVYHGTNIEFDTFDPKTQGKNSEFGKEGYYFTSDKNIAKHYAATSRGDTVYEANLEMKNPLVLQAPWEPEAYFDWQSKDFIAKAKAEGHDGIIVKGGGDINGDKTDPNNYFAGKDMYVVFDPSQIKKIKQPTGDTSTTQPIKTTMSERRVSTTGKDSLIADRKVKAYMFENPEVKPLFQSVAQYILDYEFVPNEQHYPPTEVMTQLKADTGLTPAQIKDALERLVNNHGQENVAAAKRIEIVIDDMLTNGFDMAIGGHADPVGDYLEIKSRIEGKEIKPVEKVDDDAILDEFIKQDERKQAKPYEPNVKKNEAVSDVPEQFKGTEPGDIDYKPVKVGAQVQIVSSDTKGQTPKFEYADPELEAVHKKNKGVSELSFVQKVKKGIEDTLNMFTRPIGTLPYTAEFAELYKDLTLLPKLRAMASDDTNRVLESIVKGMDRNGFDIFERKVLLDDLAEEAKLGNVLPNKWTPEKVQSELSRLDKVMPDSVKDAVDKRKQFWENLKNEFIEAKKEVGVDVSETFTRENYFRHQVLEYIDAKNSIKGTGKKLKTPVNEGFTMARSGEYEGDINTDYLQAEFEVMAQMKYNIGICKLIKNIDENYNIVDIVKANAKAEGIENWHDAIPEGYTTWQPREGNVFFMSQPIGAELVQQSLAMRGIKMDDIKDSKLKVALEDIMNELADQTAVLAMGGKRKEFVVKNEVAETLDNLNKTKTTNILSRGSKKIQSIWKRWVTSLNPKSTIKYGIRNFTGDIDAVIAGNPGAVKKIPQAAKELYDAISNGKFTAKLKSWYDVGGYQSLLYTREISQVNKAKPFEKFRDLSTTEKITKPLKNYAEFTEDMHNYREAINRYAAYLDYLEQLQNGKLKNYGASRPEIIDALSKIEDKAFKLSNDLLGAYDEVSQAGQVMRNHLIPFYSWMEINMKRYKNLFKNAFENKEVARSSGMSAGLIAKLGLKTAGKLISIFGMTAALAAWNQLLHGDLEEELPEDVRARPHIILGKDKDGNVLYFSRMGSLNDFLEWFGLDSVPQDVKDVMNGKVNISELIVDMGKSAVNKIAGSITPAYKTTAELLTGQKLYPDIFNPMQIRDRAQYAAQSFGLKDEFDVLTGKPHRPYFENLDKALLYKADPKESAYYSILNEKSRYKKKKGEEGGSFFYTKKSNALYNYKLALRYGDEKAQEKYLKLYESYGGNAAQTIEGVLAMSPYYGIKKEERAKFKASLTGKDKERLELAEQYFIELLETELTSKRKLTSGTKAMLEIYKKTGETKQFPKVVSGEITHNGKKYKLSKVEIAKLQGRADKAMYKAADSIASQESFKKLSPEQQAEMMSNVLNQQVAIERAKWKAEKYK